MAASVGGRIAPACLTKTYRPHLRVGSGKYLGVAFCGMNPASRYGPGVCVNVEVKFVYAPDVDYTPLVVGSQFQIPKVQGLWESARSLSWFHEGLIATRSGQFHSAV